MNNTVELIHKDFDTAIERIKNVADMYLKKTEEMTFPKTDETDDIGEFLNDVGFENVDIAKHVKDKKREMNEISKKKSEYTETHSKLSELLSIYSGLFPFHKFILYPQVIEILEKYNLYIGHSSLYRGNIPKKNLLELKNFPWKKAVENNMSVWCNKNTPLCSTAGSKVRIHKPLYWICAPKKDFKRDNHTYTVGKEIFRDEGLYKRPKLKDHLFKRKVKDPIILFPVIGVGKFLGFIIVTKWGKESDDVMLTVPKNN